MRDRYPDTSDQDRRMGHHTGGTTRRRFIRNALFVAAGAVFAPVIRDVVEPVSQAIGDGLNNVNRARMQSDYDEAVRQYKDALRQWHERVQPMSASAYLNIIVGADGQVDWRRLDGYQQGSVGGGGQIPIGYLLSGAIIRPATQPYEVNPTADNVLALNEPLKVRWYELFAGNSNPNDPAAPRAYLAAYEGNGLELYSSIGANGALVDNVFVIVQPHVRETETDYTGTLHYVHTDGPYQGLPYQGTLSALTADPYYTPPTPPQKPAGL